MSSDEYDLELAEELLKLSREALLRKLAEDREPGFIGDWLKESRRILETTAENQREKICNDERVKKAFLDKTGSRRALIVCAIADALGTSGAMTIAALIVQDGLDAYCEAIWNLDAG